MNPEFEALETVLDYRFRNRELLRRALTHRSSAHEKSAAEAPALDNEQLEFLGDSVLGFIVSDVLLERHPTYPEGRLSKLKAHLVSASHLYEVAARLDLGSFLLLGRGEELSGGRGKKALLADALEAIIAAVYLDGGFQTVRRFVVQLVLDTAPESEEPPHMADYKGALQEMAQAMKLPSPRYSIVEERGPDHAKTFLVEVRVGPEWVSRGEGLSKKSAGQQAAQKVLQQLVDWGR